MVNTKELETYLKPEICDEGDICEVTGEGEIKTNEDNRKILNIPVLLNGSQKLTYSPAKLARKELEKAWGTDTLNWVKRKFAIKFAEMQVGKEYRKVIKPVPLPE